jgi:hypothetical protein
MAIAWDHIPIAFLQAAAMAFAAHMSYRIEIGPYV